MWNDELANECVVKELTAWERWACRSRTDDECSSWDGASFVISIIIRVGSIIHFDAEFHDEDC